MMLYRDHRAPLTSAQQARQMHPALASSMGWALVQSMASQSRWYVAASIHANASATTALAPPRALSCPMARAFVVA